MDDDIGSMALTGTPLAEIFSIRLNFDADQFQVFGLISAEDKYGPLYLFKCTRGKAETIRQGTLLPLICPFRPISAASPFTITFDLKCKNQDNSVSEFVKDSFTWEGTSGESYDKCTFVNIKGKQASALMYMTVFKAGLWAEVKVKLIAGDTNLEGMYGRIVAHFDSRFDHSGGQNLDNDCKIIVFEVEENIEDPKKKIAEEISLLRPRFAVPAYGSLLIDADLNCVGSGEVEYFKRRVMEFPAVETFCDFHVDVLKGHRHNIIRVDVSTKPWYFFG